MASILLEFRDGNKYELTDELFINGSGFIKEAMSLSGDFLPVFSMFSDTFFRHYTHDSILENSDEQFKKLVSFWEYIAYYDQIDILVHFIMSKNVITADTIYTTIYKYFEIEKDVLCRVDKRNTTNILGKGYLGIIIYNKIKRLITHKRKRSVERANSFWMI